VIKHEADVLKDRKPEDLHQMRVGMRRLRSHNRFCPSFKPAETSPRKKLAKLLASWESCEI